MVPPFLVQLHIFYSNLPTFHILLCFANSEKSGSHYATTFTYLLNSHIYNPFPGHTGHLLSFSALAMSSLFPPPHVRNINFLSMPSVRIFSTSPGGFVHDSSEDWLGTHEVER